MKFQKKPVLVRRSALDEIENKKQQRVNLPKINSASYKDSKDG